jgi:hypothetical protein
MSADTGSPGRCAGSRPAAELEPRVRALQECCTHILAWLDQSKDDMDRYYYAFQLEDVVSQTVHSPNELIKERPGSAAPTGLSGARARELHRTWCGGRHRTWRPREEVAGRRVRARTEKISMPSCRLHRGGETACSKRAAEAGQGIGELCDAREAPASEQRTAA